MTRDADSWQLHTLNKEVNVAKTKGFEFTSIDASKKIPAGVPQAAGRIEAYNENVQDRFVSGNSLSDVETKGIEEGRSETEPSSNTIVVEERLTILLVILLLFADNIKRFGLLCLQAVWHSLLGSNTFQNLKTAVAGTQFTMP